ncbi:MAG: hypothetical protein ACRC5T_09650, partial [Cetobacterium sp.]
ITINGIAAQIKADNSLLILDEKAVSNGYNLEGVTITNKDGAYTFEKDGKSVKLVVGSEDNYTITKDGIKYEFNKISDKALATTGSKYGEITYYVSKDGSILDNKITINGIAAQIKGDNSLLILDEKAVSNGYNLEGVTITNKDGAYTFEKDGKIVTLKKTEEGNYHLNLGGYNYYLDSKGELILNDLPASEDGELPEIGIEKEWDLASESKELSSKELEELLLSEKAYEKDGKYYIVTDLENKIAQEITIVNPPVTNPEDTIITNSSESKEDGDILVKSSDSNVKILENVVLTVSHNNSIGVQITNSKNLTNEGNILISGDKSIGILADTNATAINNGTIIGKSNVVEGVFEEVETDDNGEKEVYTTKKKYDWIEGMRAESEAVATNNNVITIDGSGAGMLANSGSLENNGTIEVKSGDQEYILEEYNEDGTLDSTEFGTSKEYVAGMKGRDGSKITNGEKGKIVLVGEGQGMLAVNNSEAINKGIIEVTAEETKFTRDGYENNSWTESIGIIADEESIASNEGTIIIKNSGIGMISEDGSTVINNKDILITGSKDNHSSIKGMEILRNSNGENNGLIRIDGNLSYVQGVTIEESGNFINGKDGVIEVTSSEIAHETSVGMFLEDRAVGINSGLISVVGMNDEQGKSIYGVVVANNSFFTNEETGVIEIESKGNAVDQYGHDSSLATGIDYYSNDSVNKGKIENKGSIKVHSTGSAAGIYASGVSSLKNSGDIYVESDSELENNGSSVGIGLSGNTEYTTAQNSGNITVKGKNAIGISSNIFSSGETNILNTGKIFVSGKDAKGISYSKYNGEITSTESNIVNQGTISADGEGAYGIYVYNGIAINDTTGIINVGKDAEVGMFADGVGSKIINNGKILITSTEEARGTSIGMNLAAAATGANSGLISIVGMNDGKEKDFTGINLENTSSFTNEKKGVIELELGGNSIGDGGYPLSDITGIEFYSNDSENKGKVENKGSIKVYSTGSSTGIYAYGEISSLKNSGDIYVESDFDSELENHPSSSGISLSGIKDYATIENSGNITAKGKNAIGIQSSVHYSGEINILNTGKIFVSGKNAKGISYSKNNGEITSTESNIVNQGTISVDGEGAYGIYVDNGIAINDTTGIINVGKDAAGGMFADGIGSKIINKGIINIDNENTNLLNGKSES